jgi:hypothetical protein
VWRQHVDEPRPTSNTFQRLQAPMRQAPKGGLRKTDMANGPAIYGCYDASLGAA